MRGRSRAPAQAGSARRFGRRLVAGRRALDRSGHHLLRAGGAGRAARTRSRASLKRSGWGWPRVPTRSSTTERTIRSTGTAVRNGHIHIGVSVFSDSEETWRRTMRLARQHYEGFPGITVLTTQDFGAQPGDLNPLGYKDSIGQPAIEGSGVEPLPGQGPPIKAGEFILGYPGEAGVPLPAPQPDVLGTERHVRRTAQVPVAGRGVQPLPAEHMPEQRAGAGTARREAGGALAQRRTADARARRTTTRRSAPTRCATTTSPMPTIRTAGRCRSARTCGG